MTDYLIVDWYHNYGKLPGNVEVHNQASKTIPGMVEPLEDLLNKGVAPTLPLVYEGYDGLPDVRTMSKIEKEEFKRTVYASIEQSQKALFSFQQRQQLKLKAEKDAKLLADMAELEQLRKEKTNL